MKDRKTEDQRVNELFEKFFHEEYEGLIRFASAALKRRDSAAPINGRAEVAVQEMFVLAWDRRDEVLASEEPVGWLYNALYYKVLEILKEENRWRKRLLRYERNYTRPEEPHISLSVELGGENFNLLCRIYMEGYSYAELCQELGLTKSQLAVKVYRVKQKIREQIQDEK